MWGFPSFLYNRAPVTNEKIPAETVVEKIIAAAKSIVGQQETKNNLGFKNPDFQKRIEATGWHPGEAWCCYTAEAVWDIAFQGHRLRSLLDKLFSGSSITTYRNFERNLEFVVGQVPKPGAIVIWQLGKTFRGHTGIVVPVITVKTFDTVEGNGNSQGGSEGIEVVNKIGDKARKLGEPFKPNGLNLLGFIYPPEE